MDKIRAYKYKADVIRLGSRSTIRAWSWKMRERAKVIYSHLTVPNGTGADDIYDDDDDNDDYNLEE